MAEADLLDLPLSGASPAAAQAFREACGLYHCYAGDPVSRLDAAIAEAPGFVMAHVLKGYMFLAGAAPPVAAIGRRHVATAAGLAATPRERGHVAAAQRMAEGRYRAAGEALAQVAGEAPRDVVALQVGQLNDFLIGDTAMLRDRIAAAAPAWSADMPAWHCIQGMLAFGLEENGDYAAAEAAGRTAIALEPRNGWAQHAVAHVMEMQGRREEGVAWMKGREADWGVDSFFAVHNWWHLALFHLGLGQTDDVLALYDGPLRGGQSDLSFDLVDASALLWRLHLTGADVGGRWERLADLYEAQPAALYAFDDAHAMMAFAASGRGAAGERVLGAMRTLAGDSDNAAVTAEVGLPIAEAFHAFGRGDYAGCTERLAAVMPRAHIWGGSHAQRDVLVRTLAEARRRAGS